MDEYDELQVAEWLREGVAAAKEGRRERARERLMRVIEVNDRSEQAWLWLSGVVDSPEDRRICLENVLTLNPDNAQARVGMRWLEELEEREPPAPQKEARRGTEGAPRAEQAPAPGAWQEPELCLTPDCCVYCARPVQEGQARCPHCGGRLLTQRFKREERSATGSLLHIYWVLLSGLTLAEFFLIGLIWERQGNFSDLIAPYLPFIAGPVLTGASRLDAVLQTETWVDLARTANVGLAALGGVVALGLFLRRPVAHTLGIVLVALQLLFTLTSLALGFSGYIMAGLRGVFTVALTIFMFQTVLDFSREARWERLEADRHLLNDADYYNRGRKYAKWGMWAKALLHWQRAAAMNPERDTYFAALARAYGHLGCYETALDQADQAIRVSRRPEQWQPLRETLAEARERVMAGQ